MSGKKAADLEALAEAFIRRDPEKASEIVRVTRAALQLGDEVWDQIQAEGREFSVNECLERLATLLKPFQGNLTDREFAKLVQMVNDRIDKWRCRSTWDEC
jgi:hypothetical protein